MPCGHMTKSLAEMNPSGGYGHFDPPRHDPWNHGAWWIWALPGGRWRGREVSLEHSLWGPVPGLRASPSWVSVCTSGWLGKRAEYWCLPETGRCTALLSRHGGHLTDGVGGRRAAH